MIEGDSELKKIIIQLWKSQGNVSTTAKSLYMHRNTLINKIEK
ncbi:helix-turn-helix domain-containing protein [Enterococcus faecalis]